MFSDFDKEPKYKSKLLSFIEDDNLRNEILANGYILNFHRKKRLGENLLLTTDHGSWIITSPEVHQALLNKQLTKDLYRNFEERGLIITEKNLNQIVKKFHKRYQHIEKPPALHIITPLMRCNLRCTYCHSEASHINSVSSMMDEKTVKKILEFIFQSPSKYLKIEFNGGEPLFNKEIIQTAFYYAKELGKKYNKQYHFGIVTNLTMMTSEFLNFIAKNRKNFTIYVSLDGPEEVHDWNRKFALSNKGTYKKVTSWIRRLKEKNIPLGLLMVVTKHSLRFWKEIVDEYVKWGMTSFYIKPLEPVGFAKENWNDIGYKAEKFIRFWEKCVDYSFELLEKGIVIKESNLLFGLQNILTEKNTGFLDFTSPCGMIRGQLVYDEYGDIYCCNMAKIFKEFKIGNVFENNRYDNILNSDRSKKMIMSSMTEGYYCDSCAYKPFCSVCPILHYANEGRFNIKINKTSNCARYKLLYDYIFKKIVYDKEKIKKYIKS